MSRYPSASKKVAVLTGLTMLVSGAEIVSADANTTLPETEFINIFADSTLSFQQFNQPGTLTGVTFNLVSSINFDFVNSVTATVSVNGNLLFSQDHGGPFTGGPVTLSLNLDPFFIGGSTFLVDLGVNANCEGPCQGGWSGDLSAFYTFNLDSPPSETPLPAALPLFATGVAGLAVMGLRKRRKQKAKEQA